MKPARLLAVAVLLAPLPLLAAAALGTQADAARTLPRLVVSARDGDLYVGERALTTTAAVDTEPDWSPDGREIVFVRQAPGARATSLYVVRRDGGGLRRLVKGDRVVAMPAWSGDGMRIAYAASPLEGGSFDVFTVPAAGGVPKLVAAGPAEQIAPSFTRERQGHVPDGRAGRAVPGEDA